MNKNVFTTVKLPKGEINIYDFGNIKLHAYKTNDFLNDEVFVIKKSGKAVLIESPCFFENNRELSEYLKDLQVQGMFISYHGGGIHFSIHQTTDAFDIIIPEINTVYTHMLGHDCHSIVAGTSHADSMIAELKDYISKGYDLILTSHYTPEDLRDVQTKINYIESLKKIAANCANTDCFKAEVQKQCPAYSGQNYLDMTADFFYA